MSHHKKMMAAASLRHQQNMLREAKFITLDFFSIDI